MYLLRLRLIVVTLFSLSLMACNTIEHQSEAIAKVALPAVAKDQKALKRIWSAHYGAGVGKNDVPLRLALAPSTVVLADYQGTMVALDRMTGKKRWSVKSREPFSAGPSVIEDCVLLGTEEGSVLSYKLSDGTLMWRASVGSPVFAAIRGNSKSLFVHTLADTIVALDPSDGQQKWSYAASTPSLILRRSSSPVLYQGTVLVGLSTGQLVAMDQVTGVVLWQKEIAASKGRSETQRMIDLSADPLLQGSLVYAVGYQGNVAALKANTGELLWEQSLSSYAGLAVADRTLVVPDHRGTLYAFDAITGKQRWKMLGLVGRRLTKPLCVGTMVLVGDDEGLVHWIDLESGHYKGRQSIDNKGIEASLMLKEGIIYILGLSGKVVALPEAFFHQDNKVPVKQ